jgi:hypothetical protein
MEENKNEPRVNRFCITKTWLVIWAVSSSIVILFSYIVRPYVDYGDEFSVLVDAMNVISSTLIIGLPVFLPAGIAFGTSAAKAHSVALLRSGKNPREVFLRCLTETYALILAFSVIITSALFLEPYLVRTSFYDPRGTGFLIYFPSVLIAAFVVSLLLASIGVFFVVISEDVIVSTTLGCVVTIGLATLVGYDSWTLWASVKKGIAMLSPSNLVKILAGTMSNYRPERDTQFTSYSYFGFTATLPAILAVLAIFGFVVFVGLLVSSKLFQRNTSNWIAEKRYSRSEIWEPTPERKEEDMRIKGRLKKRRLALVGLVIIVLAVSTIGTSAYTSTVIEATTIIFHQSPQGGEKITLGEWHIFPCNVQPGQYGQMNILHFECYLEDWFLHDCPGDLSFYYSMLNMSSSDFQNLNETGRRAVCDFRNITLGEWGGTGGSWNLGTYYGPFSFALKVFATENETISGYLYCAITLAQSPTFFY